METPIHATPEVLQPPRPPASSAGVQATLGVLELLVARGPQSLAELSRELGVAKSTLHRVCTILVERSWAVRDEAGRFELGIRALALGDSASALPIVVAFRSVAADLLTRHDETVCLAALDGDDSVFVAIEETRTRCGWSRTSAAARRRSPRRAAASSSPTRAPPRTSSGSTAAARS
jgi:DNA-binding IclR family transcriptional regulator